MSIQKNEEKEKYCEELKQASTTELTILMPCLNEERTIGICIKKAMLFLNENRISGEVLISDNGSTDDSVRIAESLGARVVNAPIRGYGGALLTGSREALGNIYQALQGIRQERMETIIR